MDVKIIAWCKSDLDFFFPLSLYYLDAEGNISELQHGKVGQHQTWNRGELGLNSTRVTWLWLGH